MENIFSLKYALSCLPRLLKNLPLTLLISCISMLLGALIGILLTWARLKKGGFIRRLADVYIELVRGTPFLVLLLVVFYGLPVLTLGLFQLDINNWPKLFFVILTLVLYSSARITEILRSAYESVDKGQYEASVSVGLNGFQALYHVIAPQAFYIALPNIGALAVDVFLETSMGFTIGLVDLMGQAKILNTRSYGAHTLEIYVAVALIYWIMTMIITKLIAMAELYFSRQMGLRLFRAKPAGR